MSRKLHRLAIVLFTLLSGMATSANAQLRLLSPDGGEKFTPGNIVPVLWSGIPDSVPVDIDFSTNGGLTWTPIGAGVTGRRFLWQVPPLTLSTVCLIRVSTSYTGEFRPQHVRTFQGHSSNVNSVAISPDGKLLATAGSDGILILWNLETGEKLKTMSGHNQPIILARFSPDGSKIATGALDGKAIIWNVSTGQQNRLLNGKGGMIWPVGFSPTGSTLATGNDNGSITLWSLESGTEIKTFSAHSEAVRYLEYTRDGSKIIASSTDQTASIYDASTYARLQQFRHHDGSGAGSQVIANGIQLTNDGRIAITCGYDGYVKFWDALNGSLIATKTYHGGAESSELQISPNGNWIASVGYDGTTKIVNPYNGIVLADIDPGMGGMIRSSFSSDSRYLAISHFDRKATLWEMPQGQMDISDNTWEVDICDEEFSDVKTYNDLEGKKINLQ